MFTLATKNYLSELTTTATGKCETENEKKMAKAHGK